MNTPHYNPLASTADQESRPELRKRLIAARQALPNRPERQEAIGRRLRKILDALRPTDIGAYCPIRGEFDPLPVLAEWLRDNPQARAALPRLEVAEKRMDFVRWAPGDALRAGPYGIDEPADGAVVEPSTLLVPCVGFADVGLRLGYGGGYYDRYLAKREEVYTVGLAFACCELHELDMQPHDPLMDLVVTEDGICGMDVDSLDDPA